MKKQSERSQNNSRGFGESELELIRKMFDHAPVFVGLTEGDDHRLKYINRAFRTLLGDHPLPEGTPAGELLLKVKGEDRQEISESLERLNRLYRSGEPLVVSDFRSRLDRSGTGELEGGYYNFVFQPLRKPGEDVFGMFLAGYEVTEQLELESELEQSVARLQLALKGGKVGLWEADLETGSSYSMSPRGRSHFGLPEEGRVTADDIKAAIHPDDRDRVMKAFYSAVETDSVYESEFRVIRPDGSRHWLVGKGHCLLNEEQKPYRLIGITMEITDQKEAEEKLREAVKLREDFLAIASHELQTPITSLRTMTELFELRLRDRGLDTYADRYHEIVNRIDQLARATRYLLDRAKDRASDRQGPDG